MMSFTSLILLIVGAIVLGRLFALGTRTANAAEASALALVTLVAALTPEARARANEALERICDEVNAMPVDAKPTAAKPHRGGARF